MSNTSKKYFEENFKKKIWEETVKEISRVKSEERDNKNFKQSAYSFGIKPFGKTFNSSLFIKARIYLSQDLRDCRCSLQYRKLC